jgi:hypothetical protein
MKTIISLVILLPIFFISGCGTVQMEDFDLKSTPYEPFKTSFDAKLYSVIFDYNLPGNGKEFGVNFKVPLQWKDLVSDMLHKNRVFTDASKRNIDVVVTVNYVKLPVAGLEMSTALAATYSIVDRTTNEELFKTDVRSESTIPLSYALAGWLRSTESVSRAITSNVAIFLSDLKNHTEIGAAQQ